MDADGFVFNIFCNKEKGSCVLTVRTIDSLRSVEVSEDLATDVLSLGLLVVHDAEGGGQDDLAELSGGQDVIDKLLEVLELEVVAGGDDTALVEAAVQFDHDLAGALVVNNLEFVDVAYRR